MVRRNTKSTIWQSGQKRYTLNLNIAFFHMYTLIKHQKQGIFIIFMSSKCLKKCEDLLNPDSIEAVVM